MRRDLLLMLGAFFLISTATAQVYLLQKSCLKNDWINVDSCQEANGDMIVITYNDVLIHAVCKEHVSEKFEMQVVAMFKRTSYPTLGYKHIFDLEEKNTVMADLNLQYGSNEERLTAKTERRKRKNTSKELIVKK